MINPQFGSSSRPPCEALCQKRENSFEENFRQEQNKQNFTVLIFSLEMTLRIIKKDSSKSIFLSLCVHVAGIDLVMPTERFVQDLLLGLWPLFDVSERSEIISTLHNGRSTKRLGI